MMWWDSTNYDLKVYNDNDTAWNSLVQGPATTTDGYIPDWDGTIGNKLGTGYLVATTVGTTGSDTTLVTEQGIREAISSAVSGGVNYQGAYNASTNTPDLESGTSVLKGYMYTVTVAGDFFTDTVAVGDVLIAENDAPTTLAEWTIVAREWDETFLELGDTPSAYTGAGGYMVMVNSTPNGLEFIDPSGYALSNFNNDLSFVNWGTATNNYLVFGSASGDIESDSNLAWDEVLHQVSIDGGASDSGQLHIFYNAQLSVRMYGASTLTGYVDSPNTLYLNSTHATTPRVVIGNTGTNGALLSIRHTANTQTSIIEASTAGGTLAFDLREDGSLYIPALGSDDTEDHVLAVDDTTGLITKRSVASMSGGGTFLSLTDTPSAYTGAAGQFLQVNATPDALVFVEDLVMNNGAYIRSGNTAADVLYIAAYDVDGAAEVAFITLTSNNTPTCDLSTSVTVGSNAIAYAGGAFHDGFSDFVGNEHIDHTGVTITAGSGLSYSVGGTDISASATIDLDINSLGTETTIAAGDFVPFWDITATATNKKILFSNFEAALTHDNLTGVSANEHVDHTGVTITAGSGLSYSVGGTDISASATIDLDINSLGTETVIADGDFVPFWDITATATNKKITYANLSAQIQSDLDTTGYAKIVAGDLGSGASPTITHNFNLTEITDVIVQIWRQADNKLVGVEITAATLDTVTVSFGDAAINPSIGTFRYMVAAIQE